MANVINSSPSLPREKLICDISAAVLVGMALALERSMVQGQLHSIWALAVLTAGDRGQIINFFFFFNTMVITLQTCQTDLEMG